MDLRRSPVGTDRRRRVVATFDSEPRSAWASSPGGGGRIAITFIERLVIVNAAEKTLADIPEGHSPVWSRQGRLAYVDGRHGEWEGEAHVVNADGSSTGGRHLDVGRLGRVPSRERVHLLDARSGGQTLVARTASEALGLSIEGDRVAWAEAHPPSRVRAVVLR